jgi:hypothetical protein
MTDRQTELRKYLPSDEGKMGGFVRNMMAGDRERPYKQGWDSEADYNVWMVRWIGGDHQALVQAYRAKEPSGAAALAEMDALLSVMAQCKDAVQAGLIFPTTCDAANLTAIMNKLLSKNAPAVLAAMSKAGSLPDALRIAAQQQARAIWVSFSDNGEPLREETWELAISLLNQFPGQLPATYRIMLYKILFVDLKWMHDKPLPPTMEQMVRTLHPNPPGLSYVPWKPPSQRGTGLKRAKVQAAQGQQKRQKASK